jgi:hypothetical protein
MMRSEPIGIQLRRRWAQSAKPNCSGVYCTLYSKPVSVPDIHYLRMSESSEPGELNLPLHMKPNCTNLGSRLKGPSH